MKTSVTMDKTENIERQSPTKISSTLTDGNSHATSIMATMKCSGTMNPTNQMKTSGTIGENSNSASSSYWI
jgi:hypothetical protein